MEWWNGGMVEWWNGGTVKQSRELLNDLKAEKTPKSQKMESQMVGKSSEILKDRITEKR